MDKEKKILKFTAAEGNIAPKKSDRKPKPGKRSAGKSIMYSDEEISQALEKHNGLVFVAAKELGCCPATIYIRMKASKQVKERRENARGLIVDEAEDKLVNLMRASHPWAIRYILDSLGVDRGYGKQHLELTGKDGGAVSFEEATIEARRSFILGVIANLSAELQGEENGMSQLPLIEARNLTIEGTASPSANGTSKPEVPKDN